MAVTNQLSFDNELLSNQRKISKLSIHLNKLDRIIDWQPLVQEISIIDKTDVNTGGLPRKNPLWMIKATFLQSLFSLSDPHLEDQLIDRLNFQRFVGLNLDQEIPDFTTFWRFKEALRQHDLEVNQQMEVQRLMIKKGSIVDASIIPSSGRASPDSRRKELAEEPSPQIDTDTKPTRKADKYYFIYGTDYFTKYLNVTLILQP